MTRTFSDAMPCRSQIAKWQVVDKGSLNGSMVNSNPIGAAQTAEDSSTRQQGPPVSLEDGDVLTIGTTSRIKVRFTLGPSAYRLRGSRAHGLVGS